VHALGHLFWDGASAEEHFFEVAALALLHHRAERILPCVAPTQLGVSAEHILPSAVLRSLVRLLAQKAQCACARDGRGRPRLHYRLLTLCPGASSGPQGQ